MTIMELLAAGFFIALIWLFSHGPHDDARAVRVFITGESMTSTSRESSDLDGPRREKASSIFRRQSSDC
jgi:hypothetical protein